jgi:hypothetical protein
MGYVEMRSKSKFFRGTLKQGALAGLLVVVAASASALPFYYNQFTNRYSQSTLPVGYTQGYSCSICHVSIGGGGVRNPYGQAFAAADFWLPDVENLDSDGDGVLNIDEINASMPPGWNDRPEAADAAMYLTDGVARPDANYDGTFDVADVITRARAAVPPPAIPQTRWTSVLGR